MPTNQQSRRPHETDGFAFSPYDAGLGRALSGGVELRGVPRGSQVQPLYHTPAGSRCLSALGQEASSRALLKCSRCDDVSTFPVRILTLTFLTF